MMTVIDVTRCSRIVLVSLALCSSFTARASLSAKESLALASSHFDKGQYKNALDAIKSLNVRNDLDNSDEMKLAFKIRAIAFEQTGDQKSAVETIRELFFLDSNYNFDPFDTPISVVKLAQQEKSLIDEKNKHLAAIKTTNPENSPQQIPIKQSIALEKRPHASVTLFPFGINHFYLGAPFKGGVYLSLQALGLLTNIGAFWWKQSYLETFGRPHLKEESYRGRFETAQIVQYLGFSTLILSFSISVIDALISFKSLPTQKITSPEITFMHGH
jgi:hypothetical protein